MYSSLMSLNSIKLRGVKLLSTHSDQDCTATLPSNEHAYFVIPGDNSTQFRAEETEHILHRNHLLVTVGSRETLLVRHGVPLATSAEQYGTEYDPEHSSTARFNNALLVLRVSLCDQIRFGLRNRLPRHIYFEKCSAEVLGRIEHLARLVELEIQEGRQVSSPVLDRLTELLFLECIEYFLKSEHFKSGVTGAFSDKRLQSVVSAIHDAPDSNWTVSKLASVANMSRSLFAARFKTALNETPLNYVRLCRINKAKNLLDGTTASIDQVAQEAGYASISSFVKAFAQIAGVTPGQWRQQNNTMNNEDGEVKLEKVLEKPQLQTTPVFRDNPD